MAAEVAREGQGGIAVANEVTDVGEEEGSRQHAAVGEPSRAEQQVRWKANTDVEAGHKREFFDTT